MPNTALEQLSFLIGKWRVEMNHSALPEPLEWVDTFEWLDDSFIIWHWQGKNEVPKSTSVIGRNEQKTGNLYTMLYHDVRGVSRVMEMSYENGVWKHYRIDSEFSQRFEGKVKENNNVIEGIGEASGDGGNTWNHDYSISFTRI